MLDGISIGNWTAGSLLGLAIFLILIGRLVPKSQLDKAEEAAEKWRLAYEAEKEAHALSEAQTSELLELAKTTNSIVFALFGASERVRHSGGAGAIPTPQ
jgi:hypothetical protein